MNTAQVLTDKTQEILLSDDPDISKLQGRVEKALNLSPEEARIFIYQVVLQLNSAYFTPVTSLELVLTEGCNLACTYCFEKNMLKYRQMSHAICLAAVNLLFDYSRNEPQLFITYFGGEPLLNFSAVQYVTEYAEWKATLLGKSLNFNMTSNGVLLTETMANYLAQHKINVLLSVDGLEPTHNRFRVDKDGRGTFEQVMKGFRILKRTQSWVGVKITVMPENVSNLFGDVLGLYGMGVNQFIIGYATGVSWSEEDKKLYRDQMSELFQWYKEKSSKDLRITDFDDTNKGSAYFGCRAGRNSLSVSVDGQISPCSKVLALDNRRLLGKLGDVHYGLTHPKNRFELASCTQLRAACENRGIAADFKGGCFASNYEENNDLFVPSMEHYAFSKLKP
ncbi:MAG TPA: radical SAM protein [Candidatus Hypogeohydataceae bacterium YC41]